MADPSRTRTGRQSSAGRAARRRRTRLRARRPPTEDGRHRAADDAVGRARSELAEAARTGGGGRSPTWTTCASASRASSSGSARGRAHQWRRSGCRSSTTWTGRSHHAEADPARIVEGVRAVLTQAVAVLGRLGFPRRDDDVGSRSTRPGTRRSPRCRAPTAGRAPSSTSCGPATATTSASCGRPRVVVATRPE